MKGTQDLSVLFLTTARESTITPKFKKFKYICNYNVQSPMPCQWALRAEWRYLAPLR